jgi:hypothetical protein
MGDSDEWSAEGSNILSPDRLEAIRRVLEEVGPVILEHWFYYGSRSPDRLVFEDFEELLTYLQVNARPGDALHVWDFAQVCRNDNTLADGKYPDSQGRTPKGGAY